MEYFFGAWIIAAFLVAFAGEGKKIGYWNTFLISLLLSPVVGLIVGLVSKPVNGSPNTAIGTELERLKTLYDSGTLSKDEFEAAKKKVIA